MGTKNIMFLGTKGPTKSASARGQDIKDLQKRFTRLTPRLLATIPEAVLPSRIRNKIKLLEGSVMVSEDILREGLSTLKSVSDAHQIAVGEHCLLPKKIETFRQIIPLMEQALDPKQDGILLEHESGRITFHVNERLAQIRGIEVWLSPIRHDSPDYKGGELGLYIRINRYYGSFGDYILLYVPLNIRITDYMPHNIHH